MKKFFMKMIVFAFFLSLISVGFTLRSGMSEDMVRINAFSGLDPLDP